MEEVEDVFTIVVAGNGIYVCFQQKKKTKSFISNSMFIEEANSYYSNIARIYVAQYSNKTITVVSNGIIYSNF